MLSIYTQNELKNIVPKHVEEIIFYLKERGYKLECFKELSTSKIEDIEIEVSICLPQF